MLQTGFANGLDFLTLWQCWRADPARPRLLHVVALLPAPPSASALRQAAAPDPALAPLAEALCAQWHGLQPGVHRLALDDGQVLLTLHIGALQPLLRTLSMVADSVVLDAFSPSDPSHALDAWPASAFKAVARCCQRGTGVVVRSANPAVRKALAQSGFVLAPDALHGHYDPPWVLKRPPEAQPCQSARCVVVGGGLAGAAVAASLARRGWQVQVLDAVPQPASGASGLPAGVLAPHVSPDDGVLSRLSRSGVRATLAVARTRLQAGVDWQPTGVLEHRVDGTPGLPSPGCGTPVDGATDDADTAAARPESTPASATQRAQAGLPTAQATGAPACWHAQGGWVQPPKLVQALLTHPHITWCGGTAVGRLARAGAEANGSAHSSANSSTNQSAHASAGASASASACASASEPHPASASPVWQLFDTEGALLAEAELVVLAAGWASRPWLGPQAPLLSAVRGQVSLGAMAGRTDALPPFPVNGHGSLIAGVPLDDGPTWITGATYERDAPDPLLRDADHTDNLARLRSLLPSAAEVLAPDFASGQVRGWAGVRCATPDRLPLVGPTALPGVWVSTGMGSRGLSLAVLCGEVLAARLHQEPLPLEAALARRLDTARFHPVPASAAAAADASAPKPAYFHKL